MKKLIYAFILLVFVLTACGKTESDKKDELVTVGQEDKSEVTEQDDKEKPSTTDDSMSNTESQEEVTKTTNTTETETNTSTSVEDKTHQSVTSDNVETDSDIQKPTTTPGTTNPPTESNNSGETNDTGNSGGSNNTGNSGGSNNAENSGNSNNTDSSSNNSTTDSQLKAEADSNASKYMSYYQEVLLLVNEIRAEAGVGPLTLDMTLCKAASMRALEMDYNNVISHTRPDGSDCWTVLDFYDAQYSICGENIAAGYRSADAVVKAWKKSPSHYENMITPSFTKLGVGYSMTGVGNYGYYWCQVFTN